MFRKAQTIAMRLLAVAAFTLVIAGASPLLAQEDADEPVGSVWVADEYGNSITVINAQTNEVITTFTAIEAPHNIQVADDGSSVWAISGHDALAPKLCAKRCQPNGHCCS